MVKFGVISAIYVLCVFSTPALGANEFGEGLWEGETYGVKEDAAVQCLKHGIFITNAGENRITIGQSLNACDRNLRLSRLSLNLHIRDGALYSDEGDASGRIGKDSLIISYKQRIEGPREYTQIFRFRIFRSGKTLHFFYEHQYEDQIVRSTVGTLKALE